MAKRFTDTEKWKKPFVRGLQGAYKLLWMYLLDDCDHAGIWQVDFEVASIRIGEKIKEEDAKRVFGDRIEVFAGGAKWFIRDFIDFQYGELRDNNRLHLSVISILKKNKLGPYKGLISPQGQGQGNGQGIGKGQGTPEDPDFKDYEMWTESILSGNDWLFNDKARNMNVPIGERLGEFATSHLALLAKYPKMKPPDQNRFRISLISHIQEKLSEKHGKGTTKNQHSTANKFEQTESFGSL